MRFSLRICTGKHAGREIPIRGPRFIIGCADNCHLKIPATQASPYHCALLIQDDGIWLRDYGDGTKVGGMRIVDRRRLDHGDQLQIGSLHFELLIQDAPVKGNDQAPDEGEDREPDHRVDFSQALVLHVSQSVAPVPELSDVSDARSESPKVPPEPHTAPSPQPDPAADDGARKKSHKAPVPAPPITPEEHMAATWLVTADGEPKAMVMFVLGILVGIGLYFAASAFFAILGQPAAT